MRKLCVTVVALISALAFLVVGSPSASAFGTEVLGCSFDSGSWIANACSGAGDAGVNSQVYFTPHNLSGSYGTSWTVTGPGGGTLSNCTGGTVVGGCISAGCTSGQLGCWLTVNSAPHVDRVFTATLTLTQAGQTRTISATATAVHDTCLTC